MSRLPDSGWFTFDLAVAYASLEFLSCVVALRLAMGKRAFASPASPSAVAPLPLAGRQHQRQAKEKSTLGRRQFLLFLLPSLAAPPALLYALLSGHSYGLILLLRAVTSSLIFVVHPVCIYAKNPHLFVFLRREIRGFLQGKE